VVAFWYLLILAPFIAIPVLWWSYRRKQEARERAAGERWQAMLSKPARRDMDPAADTTATAVASVAPLASSTASPSLPYRSQARVLDQAETLAYYLLRTSLPEYEVLTRVGLDRLLAPTAEADRERLRRGLSQHSVDYVLCDKTMRPLVAIDLLEAEAPAALTAAPDFKAQCLAHTGIRYIRIPRNAFPKRQDVRSVVLGAAASD
jgi:hypothetical protein